MDETAWRAELLRALGGDVDGEQAVFLDGIVLARSTLIDLRELARGAAHPEAPVFRQVTAQQVVTLARWFRRLGLTRHDVRRLDLGRRHRVH